MDLTTTQAVAAARAENPGWPADDPSSPAGVALAALVRPEAGGWLLCRALTRAVSARPGPGLR